jgi:hypothetical protein
MKQGYGAYMKIHRGRARGLVAVVLLILLTQVLGDNRRPLPPGTRMVPVPEAQKLRIAKGLAGKYGLGAFEASLEMKEHADFFLTPALLVQEAISDDIIITYPTE